MKVQNLFKIGSTIVLAGAMGVFGVACSDDADCPAGSTPNPDFDPDLDISETNKECLLDEEAECSDDDGCTNGFCGDDGTCTEADLTCVDDLVSTPGTATDGGTTLVVLEEIDFTVETDLTENGCAPADCNDIGGGWGWCSGSADNYVHAWRVQYSAPAGDFPATIAGLTNFEESSSTGLFIEIFRDEESGDRFQPKAVAIDEGADGTSGSFVFYQCITPAQVGASWAIQYINGTEDVSNPACFDIGEETHPCTGSGC